MPAAGDDILPSDLPVIIARGRRITSTGNVTTTETGALRVDNVPVYAGKGYRISTSNINLDTSVDNDVASVFLRLSTSGAATTSSTQIGEFRNTIDSAAQSNKHVLIANYFPSADATISVLISLIRKSGTGNIIIFCSSTEVLDLIIEDMGDDPGDTGVVI